MATRNALTVRFSYLLPFMLPFDALCFSIEIAVRLVTELRAEVQVLLSQGGKNFWDKAVDYDRVAWEKFKQMASSRDDDNDEEDGGQQKIRIHGTSCKQEQQHDACA